MSYLQGYQGSQTQTGARWYLWEWFLWASDAPRQYNVLPRTWNIHFASFHYNLWFKNAATSSYVTSLDVLSRWSIDIVKKLDCFVNGFCGNSNRGSTSNNLISYSREVSRWFLSGGFKSFWIDVVCALTLLIVNLHYILKWTGASISATRRHLPSLFLIPMHRYMPLLALILLVCTDFYQSWR